MHDSLRFCAAVSGGGAAAHGRLMRSGKHAGAIASRTVERRAANACGGDGVCKAAPPPTRAPRRPFSRVRCRRRRRGACRAGRSRNPRAALRRSRGEARGGAQQQRTCALWRARGLARSFSRRSPAAADCSRNHRACSVAPVAAGGSRRRRQLPWEAQLRRRRAAGPRRAAPPAFSPCCGGTAVARCLRTRADANLRHPLRVASQQLADVAKRALQSGGFVLEKAQVNDLVARLGAPAPAGRLPPPWSGPPARRCPPRGRGERKRARAPRVLRARPRRGDAAAAADPAGQGGARTRTGPAATSPPPHRCLTRPHNAAAAAPRRRPQFARPPISGFRVGAVALGASRLAAAPSPVDTPLRTAHAVWRHPHGAPPPQAPPAAPSSASIWSSRACR